MPKRTKKLLIYLDQNFISEIAKRDLNTKVRLEFSELYKILKKGFLEEKLVVPQSHFHDVETSLAPPLKEHIVKYQNYVGQISLNLPHNVEKDQIGFNLQRFLGNDEDPLAINIAFRDNPDQRVKPYNIIVDSHLERSDLRTGRLRHASQLEKLRKKITSEGLSYKEQLEREFIESEPYYLERAKKDYSHLATEKEISNFIKSQDFCKTPIVSISARLYAKILTQKTRSIKEGDVTDIGVISTYLPYMDIVATDRFMSIHLNDLGIDQEFGVSVYDAKVASLRGLITYLNEYVAAHDPVNRPAISAFVLPTPSIKAQAFKFYHWLGNVASMGFGEGDYVEVYGFDDGFMPQYELRSMPGLLVPFYGLQDVHPITLPSGSKLDDVLKICRERCSSTHFVLIDNYQELPDYFFHSVLMSIGANNSLVHGYKIYPTKI
jgi:hypothetical protein